MQDGVGSTFATTSDKDIQDFRSPRRKVTQAWKVAERISVKVQRHV